MSTNSQGSDKRLELAYDAGKGRLEQQDATLSNTRSRANNVLASAALLTSVSAGVGLINTDPGKGAVLSAAGAWVILAVMLILGSLVLYVLWPIEGWAFGPSAREIEKMRGLGKSEDEIRAYVVGEMVNGISSNDKALKKKQVAFRLSSVFLSVQVLALVGAFALSN